MIIRIHLIVYSIDCHNVYSVQNVRLIEGVRLIGGPLKAGVNMAAVFWLVITALTQISRLRFKQSRISMLIPEIYVLGRFVNFLVIFRYIWR